MTFIPLDHLRVDHEYASGKWQRFTGDLSGFQINLREFTGANSGSLSFYNAKMDPSQSSGTRVIKKGDRVRIHMHKGDGSTWRKTATMRVQTAPKVDIDLTKPAGLQNKVTVSLVGTGIAGVAGIGGSSGVGSAEELSNVITGTGFQINSDDNVLARDYAWVGTAYNSASTESAPGQVLRTNIMPNPTHNGSITNWAAYSSVNQAFTSLSAQASGVFRATKVTTASANCGMSNGALSAIPADTVVTVRAEARQPVANTSITSWQIILRDDVNNDSSLEAGGISDGATTGTLARDNNWHPIYVTFSIPANRNLTRVYLVGTALGNVAVGDYVEFRNVMVETAALDDYFDGTTADIAASGITTPTNGVVQRTNLCTNPSFETNTTGWSVTGTGNTISRVTSDHFVGSACLQMATTTGNTGKVSVTVSGLTIGQVYTVSAYVKATSTTNFQLLVGASGGSVVTPGATWTRVTYTFTATATSHTIDNSVHFPGGGSFNALIDAVQVERASAATSYFDGDSADTDTLLYAWTGTAELSTSTEAKTYTEIADIDTATVYDQIVLTRDSNPGVYGYEDPDGTIQVFDSATRQTGAATLSLGPTDYSAIDMTFDTDHIINVVLIKYFEKVKAGKKGTRKVEHDTTYENSASIAKYGRFKKVHQVHKKSDFSAYASSVFAANADPVEVPKSVTIPMIDSSFLLPGFEDGHYVTKKIDVEAPDGTVYGCRVTRIQHTITPTKWTVQVFVRNAHVIQKPRQANLATEVAHNPDGTVYGEHLADDVDGTGKTVTNATVQTDSTGNRIVMRDDGSEGIIEFWSGQAGETKGSINPSVASGQHQLDIRTSKATSPNNVIARILLLGSSAVQDPTAVFDGTDILIQSGQLIVQGPINANAIHSATGGIWMDDLSGGTTTGASIGASGRVIRTTSSRRYKKHIKTMGLDMARKVLELRAVTYRRRKSEGDPAGGDPTVYPGFIAEELHDAGAGLFVAYDADGKPDGVRYAEITAALVTILADQQTRIERLESQVAALEAR